MKRLILILILAATSTASASTEYLRPTADAQQTGVGCTATTNVSSSSMSAVYSGKSGNGPTGSSATLPSVSYVGNSRYSGRVFTTWQTGHPESATTLYISANLSGTGSPSGCIYYSTNSGSTWTSITSAVTTTQTTYSVVITGANLANLEVSVSENATGSGSTIQMTVYDIWTVGTYTASTSQGPWLLSYLDEQIWRWHDGTVRNG